MGFPSFFTQVRVTETERQGERWREEQKDRETETGRLKDWVTETQGTETKKESDR